MNFIKSKILLLLILVVSYFSFSPHIYATSNPYGKYQDLYGVTTVRCTWYAWQQAYENAGVTLPGWGNAQTWYNSAAMSGYSVGKDARANSIAVWSSTDGYGHVGYVVSVSEDGSYMIVNEGGIPKEENEGIVNGAQYSTTASNLIGFIYLDSMPKTSNNINNDATNYNSTTNNNVSTKEKSNNNNLVNMDIDIDGFSFDSNVYEYNLEVDYETQIITINAVAEDSNSIITGLGQKALKTGINTYKVVVTAEDSSAKEYTINITRNEKVDDTKKENTNNVIEKKENNLIIWIIISIILFIIIITTIIYINIRKRKNKGKGKKSKKNNRFNKN